VIARFVTTVRVSVFVVVAQFVSFTVNVGEALVADVGLPEITPVEGSRARPVGSVPGATLQVSGVVPPVAARVCEYWDWTVAFGSVSVVMANEELTVKAYERAPVRVPSVACTPKDDVPAAHGVPAMTPDFGSSESGFGRLPEGTVQATFEVSANPAVASVWE
jgi:hypothetical protein